MRILIMADEPFALRERAMLSRLEVGLADEGVRVVHAVPASSSLRQHSELFSQSVTYETGRPMTRFWRAQRLVKALGEPDDEPRAVDLVHIFGRSAWGLGAEVARQVGAGLVLEIWSGSLIAAAGNAAGHGAPPMLALAPDPAIVTRLQAGASAAQIRLVPWGVHTPGTPLDILQQSHAVSIVIISGGRDAPAMAAALEGLSRVMAEYPEVMTFAESEPAQKARAWPLVKKLGITDRFTLAPDLEARRELALRADILVLPESAGDHRSLTLDAMAAGMLVIAAADPLVGVLKDGQTARLIEGRQPDRWADALSWALRERDAARALGLSGREHIRRHARASAQISAVVDAYEWMLAGQSIPFREP